MKRMMQLLAMLAFFAAGLSAQNYPKNSLFVMGTGGWEPMAAAAGAATIPQPPAVAAYCKATTGWVPCPATGGGGGSGTVTSFSAGGLSPLFTTTTATSTTTPALSFVLSTAAAHTVFGNFTAGAAAPTYSATPVFSAATLTNFPTFNQSTTGNAATATALAALPTHCNAGMYPSGILANGNSTGCTNLVFNCQPGLGDGLNAIPAGTYLTTTCRNETGATVNLTTIRCVADAGSSTCNATNGAGTGLLTGAVTGTSTYANGTQSATTTIVAGDYVKVIYVADGTTKQIGIDISGTY